MINWIQNIALSLQHVYSYILILSMTKRTYLKKNRSHFSKVIDEYPSSYAYYLSRN